MENRPNMEIKGKSILACYLRNLLTLQKWGLEFPFPLH